MTSFKGCYILVVRVDCRKSRNFISFWPRQWKAFEDVSWQKKVHTFIIRAVPLTWVKVPVNWWYAHVNLIEFPHNNVSRQVCKLQASSVNIRWHFLKAEILYIELWLCYSFFYANETRWTSLCSITSFDARSERFIRNSINNCPVGWNSWLNHRRS